MPFKKNGETFFRRSFKIVIKAGAVKLGQVVLVYSQPPEEALIGVVESIDYPIITIETVQRDSGKKYNRFEKINLLTESLSVLTDEFVKSYLSSRERKRLIEIQAESETIDMFEGTY